MSVARWLKTAMAASIPEVPSVSPKPGYQCLVAARDRGTARCTSRGSFFILWHDAVWKTAVSYFIVIVTVWGCFFDGTHCYEKLQRQLHACRTTVVGITTVILGGVDRGLLYGSWSVCCVE
jgi:hypothetical protein